MSKLKEITEGWFNYAKKELGLLDLQTAEVAEKRLKICSTCKIRTGDRCDSTKGGISKYNKFTYGCGCPLIPKSLSPSSRCPLDYWEFPLENDGYVTTPLIENRRSGYYPKGVDFDREFKDDILAAESVEDLKELVNKYTPYDSISE